MMSADGEDFSPRFTPTFNCNRTFGMSRDSHTSNFHTSLTHVTMGQYTQTRARTHRHKMKVSVQKCNGGDVNAGFSPLPQRNNFWLRSTPLAEHEEFLDDVPGFAQELLGAELQLLVALVYGWLHPPQVLDGRGVQGVEGGQLPDKVLELVWGVKGAAEA